MSATFSKVREELRAFHQFIEGFNPEEARAIADRTTDPAEYLAEEGVVALDSLRDTVLSLPHEIVGRLAEMASASMEDDAVDHSGTSVERTNVWAERHFDLAFFMSFLPEEQQASL